MSDAQAQAIEAEKNIEMWKIKKLVKRLEQARGNGTSMISLIIRTLQLQTAAPHMPLLTCSASSQGSDLAYRTHAC